MEQMSEYTRGYTDAQQWIATDGRGSAVVFMHSIGRHTDYARGFRAYIMETKES